MSDAESDRLRLIEVDHVEAWLKKGRAEYQRHDSAFQLRTKYKEAEFSQHIVVLAQGVVFMATLDLPVKEKTARELCLALNFLNDRMPYGNFELSKDMQRVAFKVSTFHEPGNVPPSVLDSCLAATLHHVSNSLEAIRAVIEGRAVAKDMLRN